jgi:hypothetical protein
MNKRLILGALFATLLPLLAQAETWKGAPVVDRMCYEKVKTNPDAHSRECALACVKSGYGIISAEGTFLKLDDTGNEKLAKLLKDAKKKDHLRVTVNGKRQGDSIAADSVSLD